MSRHNRPKRHFLQRGFSLIEAALLVVVISLALIPIVNTLGGKNQSGQDMGMAESSLNRGRSKELIAANSIMERAIAGDTSVSIDTKTIPPGGVVKTPLRQYQDTVYRQPVWYDWTFRDASFTSGGQSSNLAPNVPKGNRLVLAVLRLYDSLDQSQQNAPALVLQTFLFRNEYPNQSEQASKVGIVFVVDTSGSMQFASEPNYIWVDSKLAPPWLKYRFDSPDPAVRLNLYDDRDLDLVFNLLNDDPNTPYDERYLFKGIHNIPAPCTEHLPTTANPWTVAERNAMRPYFLDEAIMAPLHGIRFTGRTFGSGLVYDWEEVDEDVTPYINLFCSYKNGGNSNGINNAYLSRIEAARSAMLGFLVNLEAQKDYPQSVRFGLVTFSDSVKIQLGQGSLEAPQLMADPAHPGQQKYRFKELRHKLSWFNRAGANAILASGDTNIYGALKQAADLLYADSTLTHRIIVFVGDGEPKCVAASCPNNDYYNIMALATQMGQGTYPNASQRTITIFPIGVISADRHVMDGMAMATGGQAYYATSVSNMGSVFDQVAHEIQKAIFLSRLSRYHVEIH